MANAPIENLEITLEHGAILEGQILGLDFEQLGQVRVAAEGGRLLSAVWATVPSEPLSLVLPPAGRMQVRVPELESSTLIASLSLLDANGESLRGIDLAARNFHDRWQLVGGATEVDAVPAGLWTLLVEAPDGSTWSKTVVTSGADATVVLD